MSITQEMIYKEPLACNCPQCFTTSGLEIRFKQDWKDTFFSKKATRMVREELYCKQCKNVIYPVDWSDDIERLYEYHLKRAEPITYSKLKPSFWLLTACFSASVAVSLFFWLRP